MWDLLSLSGLGGILEYFFLSQFFSESYLIDQKNELRILYLYLNPTFNLKSEPEFHIDNILEYIDTNSDQLKDGILYNTVRDILVRNTTEHFALPITITIVLLGKEIKQSFNSFILS